MMLHGETKYCEICFGNGQTHLLLGNAWILMKHNSVVVYAMGEYRNITFVKVWGSNEDVYNKTHFNI